MGVNVDKGVMGSNPSRVAVAVAVAGRGVAIDLGWARLLCVLCRVLNNN